MFMSEAAEHHIDQQAQDDAEHYRRVLRELVDIGVNLARRLEQQPLASAEPVQPGSAASAAAELTSAYDRLARAIRRTVMLAGKLAQPAAPAHAMPESGQRIVARKRIIREVEDVIQRNAKGGEQADQLQGELLDRLDDPDLDDDIAARPVDDIIRDICRDLGIAHGPGMHPWKRRTPADIAVLAARAAMKQPAEAEPKSEPDEVVVAMRRGADPPGIQVRK